MGSFFYTILIYPLTQIIELVFSFCNKLFDDEGIALIGVSFAVSMLTLPLYIVAESWQQKERDIQKSMKKQVDRIKQTFKGNEQYMMLTTYYNQCHYHPIMSLRSAFGLLIQIPFFTAAYTCLSNMEALQEQSFFIFRNLGAPDAIFKIGTFNVNILPIAMTIINIISGAIYLKGLPIRDKVQTYGLALVFFALLYNSPAGLVIYWTMNNVFSLIKNIFYKLKNPVKVLYWISCGAVTVLNLWLIFGHPIAIKRAVLVCIVFSLVYFIPAFVKFCNYLVDKTLVELRDNSKKRLFMFLCSSVALSFVLGLLLPTQLISSSPMEFSGIDGYGSPMFFVWNTFFQAIGLCFVWPILVYFLFKERIQTLLSFGFFALLVVSLFDAFVFTGDYGSLSKLLKFTDVSTVDSSVVAILVNIAVLALVVFALGFFVKFKVIRIYNYATVFIVFGLFVLSIVNVSIINKGYSEYKKVSVTEEVSSLNPIFHLSKTGKNVLLIFLDRTKNSFVEPMFEEDAGLESQFSGFTLFKNTISYNSHTLLGAPPCYGGYEYTPFEINKRSSESLISKQNESLLVLPRIFSEQAKDFSVTVTDPQWANYSWIPDLSIYNDYPKINALNTDGKYLDYWYKTHKDTSNLNVASETLKRNILWYGLFRLSPFLLRPAFYNDGTYWSTNTKNDDFDDYLSGYSVLEYLPKLTDFNCETENVFITISNECTHQSLFLQAPDYVPVIKVTDFGSSEKYSKSEAYHSAMGAFKRLGEYFDFLKSEGVYDNTKIIVYSDHGAGTYAPGFEKSEAFEKISPSSYHPLLLVKDFGSKGALEINNDFMTNADVPCLALSGIVDEPINPFTQKEINSSAKEDGALVCLSDMFMPHHTRSKYVFTVKPDSWYRVKDNIYDSNNWVQEIQGEIK